MTGHYKWTVLTLFWAIYFLNQADRQVIFSVMPLVKCELALDDTRSGLFGSVFFWVYALLVPVAGTLSDSWDRKKIIVVALLVWSLATFSSGLAIGFLMLLALRGVTAFGEAFYYPAANSMLSDLHGTESRATAMAIHQTSVYAGTILSGWLAGYIGQTLGWRPAFWIFGGAGIVVAVAAWRYVKEPPRGLSDQMVVTAPASMRDRLRETFQCPTAALLTIAFLGMILVNAAYLTWTPTLLYRKFGLSLAAAGFHATFWHHAFAALGVLVGGRIADRWALRNRLGRPAVQIAGLLLGAPFIYLLGSAGDLTTAIVALSLFGVFRGLYDSNLFASLYEVIRPESRATATGIMLAIAFMGGGFAPVAIGWLGQRTSLGQAMSWMSICYVVGGLVILIAAAAFFRRDMARLTAPKVL